VIASRINGQKLNGKFLHDEKSSGGPIQHFASEKLLPDSRLA
jgi:hypothetical protein